MHGYETHGVFKNSFSSSFKLVRVFAYVSLSQLLVSCSCVHERRVQRFRTESRSCTFTYDCPFTVTLNVRAATFDTCCSRLSLSSRLPTDSLR
ncbi:hypothetical protein M758_UG051600 [Ceratodon purpureus]|nr:hypothetical protein M758_UG051600 [Ceratodon purpureus]